jgi:hypothetical protein
MGPCDGAPRAAGRPSWFRLPADAAGGGLTGMCLFDVQLHFENTPWDIAGDSQVHDAAPPAARIMSCRERLKQS